MSGQLTLVRVVVRGPGMPASEDTLSNVIYKREPGDKYGVYMTLRLPRWRDSLRYPQRDDDQMKVTAAKDPFGRNVGVEFCGTYIDALGEAAASAETSARVVLTLRPLLTYLQSSFAVA